MVDFDKTYTLKINTSRAITNLNRLDPILKKVVTRVKEAELAFLEMDQSLVGISGELRKMRREAQKAQQDLKKHLGKKAREPVDKLAKSAKKASTQITKVGMSAKEAGRKLSAFGKKMSMRVTLPIVGAGAAAVKFALDLNKSMANVGSLLDGGVDDVKKLKKGVQEMAVETGKSTTDLADGLYNVVSALGESSENMDQLRIAAKASVAGVSTTTEALDLLSAVTKTYGDTSAKALEDTSDLAFMTVKLGKTTFPELAAAIGRTTPLAAALNTSQEELFGTFATLTGVTGNTAEVATQISAVYSAMLKPTAALAEVVEKLGYKSASTMIKERGFKNTINELSKAVDGNEDALAKMLGRKEGLLAILPLIGKQSDTYTKKLGAMQNAIGATDDAYKKQTEGINAQGHSWEKTKQRMIVFAQRVGDKLLPVLERFLDKLEPILDTLEKLDDETLGFWGTIAGLAAASGPIMIAVGTFLQLAGAASAVKIQMGLAGVAAGGAGNAMAGATGQARGLLSILGKIGAVGAAGAGGYLAGTALHDFWINPHSEKQAQKFTDMQRSTRAGALVAADSTATLAERQSAAIDVQSKAREGVGSLWSVENIMGQAASLFSDVESPTMRVAKETAAASAVNQRLQAQSRAEIDKMHMRSTSAVPSMPENQRRLAVDARLSSPYGASSAPVTIGPTTINVKSTGGAEATARAIDRKMRQRDREHSELMTAGRGGVTQQ